MRKGYQRGQVTSTEALSLTKSVLQALGRYTVGKYILFSLKHKPPSLHCYFVHVVSYGRKHMFVGGY